MPSGKQVNPGDLIFITGGTGFIGSYIIELLCQKGYRIRVAVRDVNKKENYDWLNAFQKKEGQIEYVQAEFGADYEKAVKGTDAVIHVASPYLYSAPDPQKDIVDPAIQGVTSMLEACAKTSDTVKRVIITSSGGAIIHFPVPSGYVFSDKDWSNWTIQNHPYFYSKRVAEQAGWDTWKNQKDLFDFAVVNPLLVFGPLKNARANASQAMLMKYLTGESTSFHAPVTSGVGTCDVRDVADAHVIALEHPNAVGKRLIVYSETRTWGQIVGEMKRQFPEYPVTPVTEEGKPETSMDVTPLKELGKTEFRKFDDMLRETVEAWINLGLVKDLRKK